MSIDLSKNIKIKPDIQENLNKKEEIKPFDPLVNLYKTKIKEQPEREENNITQLELSDKERKLVRKLKRIAQRVKRHERAHKMTAGKYGGRIHYDYTEGPKGKRYPVEGHIKLDTKKIKNDPKKNAEKMQKIRKAALAPQRPSNKDRQIAMDARQEEMQSRMKVMKKLTQQLSENYNENNSNSEFTISPEGSESEISQSLDIIQ